MLSSLSLLPLIANENQFFLLRQKLLTQPTAKQTQVAQSAAAVDIITTDLNVLNVGQTQSRTLQITINRKDNKFKNRLFVHCTHEAQLGGLAREIHTIHDTYFKGTPHGDIRLIVGYRNNHNTEYELAHKRPLASLLMDPSLEKSEDTSHLS